MLLSSLGAAVLAVAVVSVATGVALAHARADAAADLAVLAGAGQLSQGADTHAACSRARDVAARNGATVTGCVAQGRSLLVTVAVDAVVVGAPARVLSVARAGPEAP